MLILMVKDFFTYGYVPNCSKEVSIISKIKNTVPWTYLINDRNRDLGGCASAE